MKFLNALLIAALLSMTFATKPAEASSRETANLVVGVIGVIALLKIAEDLEPYHGDPYWEYRSRNCYYRPIYSENERTTCHRNRGRYYHDGHNYECVTVTTYNRDYIRTCR